MPCRVLFLLLLLALVRASGAESSPHLPAPKDVKVYSYNFRSSLRWSAVEVDRGLVLYTVHFKTGAFDQWDEMNCTRITQTECSFPWSLKRRRWTFFLRVRAELGQVTSDWVETDPFVADRDTTLGPPKVNSVIEDSDSLFINVTPPFESEAGDFFQYHVSYWENATSTTKKEATTSNAVFQIGNLKESTLYCFRIQAELMTAFDLPLLGLQSVPECYRTTMSEATRAGYITLIFVVVVIFVQLITVGLFLLWRHHETIKHWIQPPLEIPSHFEEKDVSFQSVTRSSSAAEMPSYSKAKQLYLSPEFGNVDYLKDSSMPGLELLDSYAEDSPDDSLSIVFFEEGSQACGSSSTCQVHSPSTSSDSQVT